MKRRDLRQKAHDEAAKWGAKTYTELALAQYPIAYDTGEGVTFYQTEVCVLERTQEYIHLAVSVSNGGWSSFFPVGETVIVASANSAQE